MKKIRMILPNGKQGILYPVDTIRALCRARKWEVVADHTGYGLVADPFSQERTLLSDAALIGQARAAV